MYYRAIINDNKHISADTLSEVLDQLRFMIINIYE